MFNFTKKEQIVILILVILNISLLGYNVKIKGDLKLIETDKLQIETEVKRVFNIDEKDTVLDNLSKIVSGYTSKYDDKKQEKQMVCFDIEGEVANPGVYELEKGSRIIDAVSIAGGFTQNAARSNINCSKLIYDEQHIYIMKVGEVVEVEGENSQKYNINTVTKKQLVEGVPGIGEVKAQSIIKYRDKNKIKDLNELLNVEGIKEKTLENISKYIYVQ